MEMSVIYICLHGFLLLFFTEARNEGRDVWLSEITAENEFPFLEQTEHQTSIPSRCSVDIETTLS